MISEGIKKMIDYIWSDESEKITDSDLELIIGELTNKFGTDKVKEILQKDIDERKQLTEDKIRFDLEHENIN